MSASTQPVAASRTALYVYGIVTTPEDGARTGTSAGRAGGVADEASLVEAEGVSALVSPVPLEEFDEKALRARLQDLEWVETNVRAHEEVLRSALAEGPVVPFRFCTLYRDEGHLRDFLSAHAAELRDLLERLRGTVEHGVKAFADLERLAALQGRTEPPAVTPSGRDYMLRRQRERALAEELERFRHEWATEAHRRLRAAALDGTLLDLQPRELSTRPDEMLLNGAYLVRADDGRFADAVEALAQDALALGIAVETTGPWPPYNFVPRELGAP